MVRPMLHKVDFKVEFAALAKVDFKVDFGEFPMRHKSLQKVKYAAFEPSTDMLHI